MSEEKDYTPLEEGVEYTASLTLISIVEEGVQKIRLQVTKGPEEFLAGDPNEMIETPMSYMFIDNAADQLVNYFNSTAEEEAKQEKPRPKLTLVH